MNALFRFGGTPVGQAKLARESGLANNTIAANYIELLSDLGCVASAYPWDTNRNQLILRKECKFHFVNLLVVLAYHPANIRSIADFLALSPQEQGSWYEWLIAQELLRRKAIHHGEILQPLAFWQDKHNEIDFVISETEFLEVKRGQTSVLEYAWFTKTFPKKQLIIVNSRSFDTNNIRGISMENFLLGSSP